MPIYLDNAATSHPKPEAVYAAALHAMRDIGASPGRGGHRRSIEASRVVFRARESLARLFSIDDSSRIIFTHSTTESLNLALRGLLRSGDHVVTTSMEHNSLLRPLALLQKQGVSLTVVPAGRDGLVSPDDLKTALKRKTRLVAVGHVSNVCGTIQPIHELAAAAHQAGALFLLDAAQSAGCLPVDVPGTGIDLLAAPGHKGLLGPQGTGILYAADHVQITPLLQGGTGSHSSSEEQPEGFPEGFESGTHNLPGIAGLGAGVEYILERGVESIAADERQLTEQIARTLGALAGITLYGPAVPECRGAVLSFTIRGIDPSRLATDLDQHHDIAVRAGLHCAPRAHRTIGTFPHGTLRVSPGLFTSREDVAIFCAAVVECVKNAA